MMHTCSGYCLIPRFPEEGKERKCRFGFGTESAPGMEPSLLPRIKKLNHVRKLLMERDHPRLLQHSQTLLSSWRGNVDSQVLLFNSNPDKPALDDIIAVCKYVCAYATKGNESTGEQLALFKSVVDEMAKSDKDYASAGPSSGSSLVTMLLNKTVGQRAVSGPEVATELDKSLTLYKTSRSFVYIPLTGLVRINSSRGDTTVQIKQNNVVHRYVKRDKKLENVTLYNFATEGARKIPHVTGGNMIAEHPFKYQYCWAMLLLHFPHWRQLEDIVGDNIADQSVWIEKFTEFLKTNDCPQFIKADVEQVMQYEEGEEEICGPDNNINENQCETDPLYDLPAEYEGVPENADFFDGGPDCDWSKIHYEGEYNVDSASTWIDDCIEVYGRESSTELDLSNIDIQLCNKEQRFIISLVLHTLLGHLTKVPSISQLLMICSGAAGTGKSFVIKCLTKLVRQAYGNSSVQVVAPTGNAAFLVGGQTIHSFFKIPVRSNKEKKTELLPLGGEAAAAVQNNFSGLKLLIVDERSMVGLHMLAYMEHHAKIGMKNTQQPWGGVPCVLFFGDDAQLRPVLDRPVYSKNNDTPSGMKGELNWAKFTEAVSLHMVCRQGDNERMLKSVLNDMRTHNISDQQLQWLQSFQWHNLEQRYKGRNIAQHLDEHALFAYPTHQLVWQRNQQKIKQLNENVPVASVKAINSGPHTKRGAGPDASGGLHHLVYLCRGMKVMLVCNVWTSQGLYNGATGEVVDIVYPNSIKPTDPNAQPTFVMVRFTSYSGPAFIESDPKVVPVAPVQRRGNCACRCKRTQIPLAASYAVTVWKTQGMSIGKDQSFQHIVINPGQTSVEKRNPGLTYTALSRARSAGSEEEFPDFAWDKRYLLSHDQFTKPIKGKAIDLRDREMRRISRLEEQTKKKYHLLDCDSAFEELMQLLLNS